MTKPPLRPVLGSRRREDPTEALAAFSARQIQVEAAPKPAEPEQPALGHVAPVAEAAVPPGIPAPAPPVPEPPQPTAVRGIKARQICLAISETALTSLRIKAAQLGLPEKAIVLRALKAHYGVEVEPWDLVENRGKGRGRISS